MENKKLQITHSFLSICSSLLLLLLSSCQSSQTGSQNETGDTLTLGYARNLTLIEHDAYIEAVIRNPWDTTKVLHRYVLSAGDPVSLEGATTVHIPLRRAAVFTSVHCALMQELGVQDAIGGVCELEYIHLPYVHQGVLDGRIADLGNGMEPNIERIMDLQPDALMPSPFENSGGYGRLERLGIPIIECAEYMEVNPLARAEWIRFYGRLFGVAVQADSLFLTIEQRYLTLQKQAQQVQTHPRLLCEIPQSGHWYIPGAESTMGQMYQDAGAQYLFQDVEGSGSTPLSIEQVLDRALSADIWLVKHHGQLTRRQICQDTPTLSRIPAHLWLCDTEKSGFYEETPFHPERLLADLIDILHPELGIQTEKSYFCPLE